MCDPGSEEALVWKRDMFGGATHATPLVPKRTLGTSWCAPYTDQFKVALFSAAGRRAKSRYARTSCANTLFAFYYVLLASHFCCHIIYCLRRAHTLLLYSTPLSLHSYSTLHCSKLGYSGFSGGPWGSFWELPQAARDTLVALLRERGLRRGRARH